MKSNLKGESAIGIFKSIQNPNSIFSTGISFIDREFPNGGLMSGETLELCGSSNSGKTEILYHCALSCLLPANVGPLHVGGCSQSVIYIDLDGRFSVPRFLELFDAKFHSLIIHNKSKQIKSDEFVNPSIFFTTDIYRSTRETVLRNLYILHASHSAELISILTSLTRLYNESSDYWENSPRLLLVDNVSAFYWQLRGSERFSNYYFKLCSLIRQFITANRLIFISTKPLFTERQILEAKNLQHTEYLGPAWNQLVTYRMVITKNPKNDNPNHSFKCKIYSRTNSSSSIHYTIIPSGFLEN